MSIRIVSSEIVLSPKTDIIASAGGINLNPAFRTGLTGTYDVNAECTGTAEENFPPPPGVSSGQVIKLMFVLSDHGPEIHEVVAFLLPAGSQVPVPALIHADGTKLR